MRSSKPSVAELRAVCQPPELIARYSGEHWVGRLYGRRTSIYITWVLVRLGISANAVTIGQALLGAGGAALFAVRGLWGPVIAVIAVQVHIVLDCSDGEVARWRGTSGPAGIWLDRLGHYLVEATILVAMGLRAALPAGEPWSVGAVLDSRWAFLGCLAALLHLFGKAETDLVHAARAKAGLAVADDDEQTSVPRAGALASIRRAAKAVPVYRLLIGIEASLLAFAAVLVDRARASAVADAHAHDAARIFVLGALAAAAVTAAGHLVMTMASDRLRAR